MLRVLFYVEREYHYSLFKNLILYYQKSTKHSIGIHSPLYQESDLNHENFGIDKTKVSLLSDRVIWVDDPYVFRPDITYIADPCYEKVENLGFIVNISHGTISKGSYFTDTLLSFRENCADLLCLPGVIHEKVMQKYLFSPYLVSGMPKLDSVFSSALQRDDALVKLNLDPSKTTVMIAPTINQEYSLLPLLDNQIKNYFSDEYNIIFKFHGNTPKEQIKSIIEMIKENPNMILFDDFDIEWPFIASDIMISDVSSIAFEFMSLGKPVLLYDSPYMHLHPKFNAGDIEHKYRNTIYRFNSLKEVENLIRQVLQDNEYADRLKKLGNRFISVVNGLSSELIADKAEELLAKKTKENLLLTNHPVCHNELDTIWLNCVDKSSIAEFCAQKDETYKDIQFVFYFEDIAKTSPNIIRYMKTGLQRFPGALVIPLRYTDEVESQYIVHNIPETQGLSFEQLAIQLSYQHSGVTVKTEFFNRNCFAVSADYLKRYCEEKPIEKQSFTDFKKWIKYQVNDIYIIYDCVIDKKNGAEEGI